MRPPERLKRGRVLLACAGLILSAVCAPRPTMGQGRISDAVIDRYIAGQARHKGGSENGEARKVVRADLDNDGREDAVVLYTLESFHGSNNYLQYVTVFIQGRGGAPRYVATRVVGGKNVRAVGLESVVGGAINLSTLDYAPTDASCCPSRKGSARLVLKNGRLYERRG